MATEHLLTRADFPRVTATRLGLPSGTDIDDVIDREVGNATDEIVDWITQPTWDALVDAAPDDETAGRRRRAIEALRCLTEARLLARISDATGERLGTSRQGGRSRTTSGETIKALGESADRKRSEYANIMARLGFDVGGSTGIYASPLVRAP